MWEWTYSGVDLHLDGTGGQDCVNYIPMRQRIVETLVFCAIAITQLIYAYPRIQLPFKVSYVERFGSTRRILLLLHAVTFGVELGFKFSTNSLIWICNPCHVVTLIQLYLLTATPSPMVTALFRLHIHLLNGPLLAILFPVLNTRQLPFEQLVYFVQHVLILVIPYILQRNGGVFTLEPKWDMSWTIVSMAFQSLYHFVVLQTIGLVTLVNMDNILCPAISDPFRGEHYRKWAVVHQTTMISFFGKLVIYINSLLINHVFKVSPSRPPSLTLQPSTLEVADSSQSELPIGGNWRLMLMDQALWITSTNCAQLSELLRINGCFPSFNGSGISDNRINRNNGDENAKKES